jgi:hypothetical protein
MLCCRLSLDLRYLSACSLRCTFPNITTTEPALTIHRGFEQANRYVILDANGNHIGYIAEQESGLGRMLARQWFRTHRSFVTHVFDREENEVLRVRFVLLPFEHSVLD